MTTAITFRKAQFTYNPGDILALDAERVIAVISKVRTVGLGTRTEYRVTDHDSGREEYFRTLTEAKQSLR